MSLISQKTNSKNNAFPDTVKQTRPSAVAYQKAIRELTHANLRLHQLDKAKDEFISIASHELRNPMSIIKGNISMILSGDLGPISDEIRDVLTDLQVAVERQIRLVNELLDISKIEAGAMSFRLQDSIKMDQLASLLVTSIQGVAKEQNTEVKIKLPKETLPPVQADQDKVSQVLINLVTNAMKFTKKGTVTIDFYTDGDFVVTRVTDTGIGIPEKQKSLLFRKFSKAASSSVGTISAGSGLGLYISKKFISRQGGDVWLEKSSPGVGSTFCFSLPISGTPTARKVKEEITSLQSLKGEQYEQNIISRR